MDGRICGKSPGRIAPTCGNPDAGLRGPEPGPAAAQRRLRFLVEPAAWQCLSLILPLLGARCDCGMGALGSASGKSLIAFTALPAPGKVTLDEGNSFISNEQPFADHPEMGRYADRYNHLLGALRHAP